jgi:hypothetical protein
MAESDWHMRDLLQFYVSKCRAELLSVSDDQVLADDIFKAVRRVRELMLIMSCMVGAFTPSEIAALNRLDQVRLVAENEAAQMLRIGEEMALLRLWTKTAIGPQWNIPDAIRILRTGRPLPSSRFPEMTSDLLTSLTKPFIVPSSLPSNAESVKMILRESIQIQFSQAKTNHPFIPDRVQLSFNPEDDSVTISSSQEFKIRGIYDHRRWTIMEANILNDVSSRECRQILQSLNISSIADMCAAALRMATAHRLKVMQEEAQAILASKVPSPVYSVKKETAGLGHGFTVFLFQKLEENYQAKFEMNFDNGDFLVATNIPLEGTTQINTATFSQYMASFESRIRHHVFTTLCQQVEPRAGLITKSALCFPDIHLVVSLNHSGSVQLTSVDSSCTTSVLVSASFRFLQLVEIFGKMATIRKLDASQICALPLTTQGTIELVTDTQEMFETLIKSPYPLPPIHAAIRQADSIKILVI